MNRTAVAKELVKLAKTMIAAIHPDRVKFSVEMGKFGKAIIEAEEALRNAEVYTVDNSGNEDPVKIEMVKKLRGLLSQTIYTNKLYRDKW
jgi:hypothetical protein